MYDVRIHRLGDSCPGNTDYCKSYPINKIRYEETEITPRNEKHAFLLKVHLYMKNSLYEMLWVNHRLKYHRADFIDDLPKLKEHLATHKEIHHTLCGYLNEGKKDFDKTTLIFIVHMIDVVQRDIADMSSILGRKDTESR